MPNEPHDPFAPVTIESDGTPQGTTIAVGAQPNAYKLDNVTAVSWTADGFDELPRATLTLDGVPARVIAALKSARIRVSAHDRESERIIETFAAQMFFAGGVASCGWAGLSERARDSWRQHAAHALLLATAEEVTG